MAEYIDRELLLELINENCKYEVATTYYQQGCNDVCNWAVKIIKNMPNEDVVPRSEVEKIFDKYGNYDFPTEPKENFNNTVITSNWLTKRFTKKQLAEMKEQAIREANEELEHKAKQEVASQVIDEFKNLAIDYMTNKDLLLAVFKNAIAHAEAELKKKYIGE